MLLRGQLGREFLLFFGLKEAGKPVSFALHRHLLVIMKRRCTTKSRSMAGPDETPRAPRNLISKPRFDLRMLLYLFGPLSSLIRHSFPFVFLLSLTSDDL